MAETWAVWKFPLWGHAVQTVDLPKGSEVLSVGMQDSELMLWARVVPSRPVEQVGIAVIGTGHEAPSPTEAIHIGTVFDGPFVWHVFRRVGP